MSTIKRGQYFYDYLNYRFGSIDFNCTEKPLGSNILAVKINDTWDGVICSNILRGGKDKWYLRQFCAKLKYYKK